MTQAKDFHDIALTYDIHKLKKNPPSRRKI